MLDNEPKNEWSVPEGTTFICTPEDVEYTTQNSTGPSRAAVQDSNQYKLPTTFHTHIDTTPPKSYTMRMRHCAPLLATALLSVSPASAGPIGYGVCQAGCSAVVMACYSAAGFTWGATLGATAPASIILCNSAFGTCQAACAAVLLIPLP
jgi:hypothetical protein